MPVRPKLVALGLALLATGALSGCRAMGSIAGGIAVGVAKVGGAAAVGLAKAAPAIARGAAHAAPVIARGMAKAAPAVGRATLATARVMAHARPVDYQRNGGIYIHDDGYDDWDDDDEGLPCPTPWGRTEVVIVHQSGSAVPPPLPPTLIDPYACVTPQGERTACCIGADNVVFACCSAPDGSLVACAPPTSPGR